MAFGRVKHYNPSVSGELGRTLGEGSKWYHLLDNLNSPATAVSPVCSFKCGEPTLALA